MIARPHRPLAALACALLLAVPAAAAPGKATPRPAGAKAAAAPPAARRLEDVHIEGELEVPRVTFITVRRPHRYRDYAPAVSVRSARHLAQATAAPAWISSAPQPATEARKENRR